MDNNREFDIIVWGASGFTGRLVAQYLHTQYGSGLKWAMAGRSQSKLDSVRAQVADDSVPVIIADSHDEQSLNVMVQRCKVILTTVGPYGKYGAGLVAVCVKHGTHYCDLAGEVPWMRQMIDTHHEAARANGTKIVHTCGFDSVPSDMGVFYTQQQVIAKTGQPASMINMRAPTSAICKALCMTKLARVGFIRSLWLVSIPRSCAAATRCQLIHGAGIFATTRPL